jgi:hypothetical protein
MATNFRKTIILGYKREKELFIPVVECTRRKDIDFGLRFYCVFCKKFHLHGKGEGHRIAHCHKPESPFEKTGYILKLNKEESFQNGN